MTQENLQPFEQGEYARLMELEEDNNWGVPAGRYLLTPSPEAVDVRAKQTLGLQTTTEVVAYNKDTGLSLVKMDSHLKKE